MNVFSLRVPILSSVSIYFTRISIITSVLIFFVFTNIHASSSKVNGKIVDLYKFKKYEEIIELSQRYFQFQRYDELLLAKSYEKIGDYNKSNRIYRELYNQDTELWYFLAYFMAMNFERLEDFTSAIKWYRHIVLFSYKLDSKGDEKFEQMGIILSSFERLLEIAKTDERYFASIVKVLKRSLKFYELANYYLGLLYQNSGDFRTATGYYLKVLSSENNPFQKEVLRKLMDDAYKMNTLIEEGMGYKRLIDLFFNNNLYEGALMLSDLLPYDAYVAELRALSYYNLGDFKKSADLYKNYYEEFKKPETLVKAAYSFYNSGEQDLSRSYLQDYLNKVGDVELLPVEVLFLKLQLDRTLMDIQAYLQESTYFVENYYNYWDCDRVIYETFYYALQSEDELAISFLNNTYKFIKAPIYKAWAFYILGIYRDKTYMFNAISQFPGSYYYFEASKKVDYDQGLMELAEDYYSQKKLDEALDIYVELYSGGIAKDYTQDKILEILRAKNPYKSLFDIETILRGGRKSGFYEIYKLGLYDELKGIVELIIQFTEPVDGALLYYLLSKMSYELDDVNNGINYAEKMINSAGRRYLLFLPDEILMILYPHLWEETIEIHLKNSTGGFDYCFVLAIIREESRYNYQAESKEGAVGLMQVIPTTASWIMRKNISRNELFNPSKNIEVGMKYLDFLFTKFDNPAFVLAAYNGGPTNVSKWLANKQNSIEEKFIEEIPFPETRNFVKKVLTTYRMYEEIYGDKCPNSITISGK